MPGETFKQSNYIPTLDGWRAISIGLVILHHAYRQCNIPVLGRVLRIAADAGEVGVEVFFAISGLLICSRLLDEESRTRRISIPQFYLRRFFRIFPAAFLYLATIAVLAAFHLIPLPLTDWFASLFFFRNYAMLVAYLHHSPLGLHWYTGHFWSLSLEEHFYLLLPAILVLFPRMRLRILAGLAVSVTAWRIVLAHVLHRSYQFSFRTDTHLDALLIPAIFALALFPVTRNPSARRFFPVWSFPVLLALEVFVVTRPVPPPTAQAILLPMLVLSTVLHPRTLAGRFMESLPLRWIGWLSYSLYLWQELFFGVNMVGSPPGIAPLRATPFNFMGLLACASFSYYLVEKPFIGLGHRLLQRGKRDTNQHRGHESEAESYGTYGPLPPKRRIDTAS